MRASTLKDVAKAADVSIASVSRVINGVDTVTDDVRDRVMEAVRRLNYVPNWGARSLVMNRTHTVGLLLPDIYGEFFSEMIRGVDDAVRAHKLHLLVSGSHGDLAEMTAAVQAMSGRVDGLLVMSPVELAQGDLSLLANVPLVGIGNPLNTERSATIRVDNYAGGNAALRHLADMGCRRIAHIRGPAGNIEAQDRLRGFLAAAAEVGATADPQVREGDFTERSGYEAMRNLLQSTQRPDGVFVANDMMAIGALFAIKEAGLHIPRDIAVVGFDDIPLARFVSPPLSTLRVGVYELGRQALETLITLVETECDFDTLGDVVIPELVVRASSDRRPQVSGE